MIKRDRRENIIFKLFDQFTNLLGKDPILVDKHRTLSIENILYQTEISDENVIKEEI